MKFSKFNSVLSDDDYIGYYRDEITTEYSLGHMDGPGAGIVKFEGKRYLALNFDSSFKGDCRQFWLIDIGEERIAELVEWCEKRIAAYGNGMVYNADGEHLIHKVGYLGDHMAKGFTEKHLKWNEENPMPSYYPKDDDEMIGFFKGWSKY